MQRLYEYKHSAIYFNIHGLIDSQIVVCIFEYIYNI